MRGTVGGKQLRENDKKQQLKITTCTTQSIIFQGNALLKELLLLLPGHSVLNPSNDISCHFSFTVIKFHVNGLRSKMLKCLCKLWTRCVSSLTSPKFYVHADWKRITARNYLKSGEANKQALCLYMTDTTCSASLCSLRFVSGTKVIASQRLE